MRVFHTRCILQVVCVCLCAGGMLLWCLAALEQHFSLPRNAFPRTMAIKKNTQWWWPSFCLFSMHSPIPGVTYQQCLLAVAVASPSAPWGGSAKDAANGVSGTFSLAPHLINTKDNNNTGGWARCYAKVISATMGTITAGGRVTCPYHHLCLLMRADYLPTGVPLPGRQ